jgi:hypothetical protein
MWEMYKTGGTPQTWMAIDYPAWGRQLIRVYIDGDIENATPEEPQADQSIEFRTTMNLVVEGFSLDLNFKIEPAFWYLIFGNGSVDPVTLQRAFTPLREEDVRIRDANNDSARPPECSSGHRLPGRVEPARPAVHKTRLRRIARSRIAVSARWTSGVATAAGLSGRHSIIGGLRRPSCRAGRVDRIGNLVFLIVYKPMYQATNRNAVVSQRTMERVEIGRTHCRRPRVEQTVCN